MSNINTEILAAINTNDVRAIERTLNNLGKEADVLGRGTDEERLSVPGFGEIYFDGRMEECPGFVVRYDDSDDAVEPDELAAMLTEVVEFAQAIA